MNWAEVGQLLLALITGLIGGGLALYRLGSQEKDWHDELEKIEIKLEKIESECMKTDYRLTLVEQENKHRTEITEIQTNATFYKLEKEMKLLKTILYQIEGFLAKNHGYNIRKVQRIDKDNNS